ncbi:MAG: helix-turn-helix domain-containing protein [Deltaproteobacteria bacterium]|jgi:DNA-binding XRE family transcriptional regulator|nr:helix-turn-helix domain-containing protein [Deltaproteobacteria bacterium]MDL1989178.1 helix-turn-helix domain-containing protein [Deltaproteobacteria bacterium]
MKQSKRKALEEKGYIIGSAEEFLGLSKEESAFVELKLVLAKGLIKARKRKKMTQVELAKLVKSSQSRVAKMEAGDPSVSMDLLVKSHLALGTRRKTLARMMAAS